MNPYITILVACSLVGAYVFGRHDGATMEQAKQQAAILAENEVQQRVDDAIAAGIAKLEVKNVTIRQTLQREIKEVPVYRDCKHSPTGLQSINDALAGSSNTVGNIKLPKIDSTR